MNKQKNAPLVDTAEGAAPHIIALALKDIVYDPHIACRIKPDSSVVQALQKAIKARYNPPPVDVFIMDGRYVLVDGYHRYLAFKETKRGKIRARVRTGSRIEAIAYGLSKNARHGLRLSHADFRRGIAKLLDDPEYRGRSDRSLAKLCGCSAPTVAKVRGAHPHCQTAGSDQTRRYRNKHGSQSVMQTAAIGRSAKAAERPSMAAKSGQRHAKARPEQTKPKADVSLSKTQRLLAGIEKLMKITIRPKEKGGLLAELGAPGEKERVVKSIAYLKHVTSGYDRVVAEAEEA